MKMLTALIQTSFKGKASKSKRLPTHLILLHTSQQQRFKAKIKKRELWLLPDQINDYLSNVDLSLLEPSIFTPSLSITPSFSLILPFFPPFPSTSHCLLFCSHFPSLVCLMAFKIRMSSELEPESKVPTDLLEFLWCPFKVKFSLESVRL